MEFETLAIHAGQDPDPNNGAVMTPIYQTSTYVQHRVGQPRDGFEYSRTKNPTRQALEKCLAMLEGAPFGLAFASGMAATDAVLRLADSGAHVVAGSDLYGGTFRLFDKILRRYGLDFDFVDTTDPENVGAAVKASTRLVWLETPSNPMLAVTDIKAVAEVLKKAAPDVLLVVDNTFATPYLQQPLQLGADLVVHSTTKYICGNASALGGILCGSKELIDGIRNGSMRYLGPSLSPLNAWLMLNGLEHLSLRMERHCSNATALAKFLEGHPQVTAVNYPGLETNPYYKLARTQMKGCSSLLSFVIKGTYDDAVKVIDAMKVAVHATHLGTCKTTHAAMGPEELKKAGIPPTLIRVSVGLEDEADIIGDLEQALGRIGGR